MICLHFKVINMKKTNGLILQEILRNEDYVSVPWIQQRFSLSYADARRFLDNIINRGWAMIAGDGLRYKIYPKNMKLRKLERSEVDGICKEINRYSATVLCLLKERDGITFKDAEDKLKGEETARDALVVLQQLNLIYLYNERYFRCVSDRTIGVIDKVASRKRFSSGDEEGGNSSLKMLFDTLFD